MSRCPLFSLRRGVPRRLCWLLSLVRSTAGGAKHLPRSERAALALRLAGVGILLPLAFVVCYITQQSQYSSNNILQRTLYIFFHSTEQKNSLTVGHVHAYVCRSPAASHAPFVRIRAPAARCPRS